MDSLGPVGWRLCGLGFLPTDAIMFVFGEFGGNSSNFFSHSWSPPSIVLAGCFPPGRGCYCQQLNTIIVINCKYFSSSSFFLSSQVERSFLKLKDLPVKSLNMHCSVVWRECLMRCCTWLSYRKHGPSMSSFGRNSRKDCNYRVF